METAFYAGSVPHCHIGNSQKIIIALSSKGRRACVHTTEQVKLNERLGQSVSGREKSETEDVIMAKLSSSIFDPNDFIILT